jgi:hypothetical protein
MVTTRKRIGITEIEAILQKHGIKQKDAIVKEFQSLPVRQKAEPPPRGGISINQAARKYSLHERTISRWVQAGKIPIIKRTKNWLYIDEKALVEFLKQREKTKTFC